MISNTQSNSNLISAKDNSNNNNNANQNGLTSPQSHSSQIRSPKTGGGSSDQNKEKVPSIDQILSMHNV